MARSRRNSSSFSNSRKYRRKTIGVASASQQSSKLNDESEENSNFASSSSSSSADTEKLCLRLGSSSTNNSSPEFRNTPPENFGFEEKLKKSNFDDDFSTNSQPEMQNLTIKNQTSKCSLNCNSISNSLKLDSTVWSVRTSDVGKISILENKSLNKSDANSSSKTHRRRTLAVVDQRKIDSNEGTPNFAGNNADKADLPPTQPCGPLINVIAYIEVYSGSDNHSRYIANVIRDLGATVCQRFTAKVTHVIFRDGLQSTLERARARKIPCVSVLWIDSCIKENRKVSEDPYRIRDVDESGMPVIVGRLRKPRCVQSEEEFNINVVLSDERVKKRAKRAEAYRLMKEITSFKVVETPDVVYNNPSDTVLVCDTPMGGQYANSDCDWRALTETFTPDSLRAQLDELKIKVAEILGTPNDDEDDDNSECDSLAANVKRRLFEPGGLLYGTPPPSFLVKPVRSRTLDNNNKQPSTPPDTPKMKNVIHNVQNKITESPMTEEDFIKRRFVIRDSIEDSEKIDMAPPALATVTEGKSNVEDIVAKTQSLELKSPIFERKSQRPIMSHECSISPKIIKSSIDISVENDAVFERKEKSKSELDNDNDNRCRSNTNYEQQQRSPSDISSIDSSSVSVGPVVLIQRKKSAGQTQKTTINVAVNTPTISVESKSTTDKTKQVKCIESPKLQRRADNKHLQKNIVHHKKQLFNENAPNAVRLSYDKMVPATTDKTPPQPSSLSLIEKIAGRDTLTKEDIASIFEPPVLATKTQTRTTKRLRSSLFYVKTPFAVANELQRGRPSPEEFLTTSSKRKSVVKKNRRRTIATAATTVKRIGKSSANGARRRPSIVMTSVTGSNRDTVYTTVKKLGKFNLENKITDKTTHVISGDGRRTLTVLHGLVRGCYILSLDWITCSLEKGKWLDEKRFEYPTYQLTDVGKRKRKCSLLTSIGPIYVGADCRPPLEDMKTLIKMCNGKLASTAKRSQLCIGKLKNKENAEAIVVAETWLLDSITKRKLLPFDSYVI